jgi:serine/threonine protein kinase
MIEIAKGVQYMHKINIIHRDLKPENILIHEGSVKIGDLGVSKVMKTNLAQTKGVGTPYYMSKEVLETDNYGTEVDIWSMGIIFLELFLGKRIFFFLKGA